MVNILNKISLKNMQIVILLPSSFQLHFTNNYGCFETQKYANRDIIASITPLNQELDITGLPSSF